MARGELQERALTKPQATRHPHLSATTLGAARSRVAFYNNTKLDVYIVLDTVYLLGFNSVYGAKCDTGSRHHWFGHVPLRAANRWFRDNERILHTVCSFRTDYNTLQTIVKCLRRSQI
jgi:hypothetical protein